MQSVRFRALCEIAHPSERAGKRHFLQSAALQSLALHRGCRGFEPLIAHSQGMLRITQHAFFMHLRRFPCPATSYEKGKFRITGR